MHKHVRWLHQQLPEWANQGVISAQQADRIRRLYPDPTAGVPWGMLIFSGLGAVVIGLGVVLLLAFNWQAIPKFGKLSLIFGALGLMHGGGLMLLQAGDWRRQLGEALTVLGTMLFGAAIWLIAQVYHIDEHYPHGFLLWSLGALAMAWALPSVAQGLIAVAALSIWGGTECFGFRAPVHWAPLLLMIGLGGLAWKLRSRVLLPAVLAGLFFLLLANSTSVRGVLAFPSLLNISVLLMGLAFLTQRKGTFPESAAILRFFGWTGFLVVIYLLSFHALAEDALRWHVDWREERYGRPLAIYGWLPFGLMLAVWLWVGMASLRSRREPQGGGAEQWLLPLSALLCQALAVAWPVAGNGIIPASSVALAAVFNLVFLAVAGMWMARGCRQGELRLVVLGSLLLVALMTARYFDLFDSLAWRGLVFLLVGGVLFAEGFFYRRAREQAGAGEVRL